MTISEQGAAVSAVMRQAKIDARPQHFTSPPKSLGTSGDPTVGRHSCGGGRRYGSGVSEALATAPTMARELGARGSRAPVADADPTARISPAAAAVVAAIPAWWEERARAAGLAGMWGDVTAAVEADPPVALLDTIPDSKINGRMTGHAVAQAYVDSLDPGVRARHGRHYTPTDLADRVWASTRDALGFGVRIQRLPGLVRDPAAGGGALLVPPLREHLAAVARVDPTLAVAGLAQHIEGIDTDPVAAWLASVVLAAEALPVIAEVPTRRRRPLPALVRVGDGLAEHAPARAVVMNPPYGRVRLSDEDRERWASLLHGHANIYGIFMGAALASLETNGVMTALVPTSFASGLYFSRLREALVRDTTLRSMTFVSSRDGVFSGVLQETCVATVSRRKAVYTHISTSNGSVHPVARVAAPRTSGPWLLPRRADDAPSAAAAAEMPHTLTTIGWRVSTGPLVWNRRKAHLHGRPASKRLPVVWGGDVAAGGLSRDRSRNSMRYLEIQDPRDRKVMVLDEPAVLVQRTTAPEQTRRLVVADLSPGVLASWGGAVVVENHLNVLRPAVPEPLLDRATLGRVLATSTLDRVMRSLTGSVAVSAYELSALRFPGASVLASWSDLHEDQLDAAVAAAYR